MKVYLGAPRGFCAGVVRAINVVELALERYGPPAYVKHQIVHNPYVVKSLEKRGAITVEGIDAVPEGSIVVFSAHGSPPEDYDRARRRNLRIIDATCPLVTKVHNEARAYNADGRKLILVGHRGHQEVIGTMGQAPMFLVDNKESFRLPRWDAETPVAVITQTTLSVNDTRRAIDQILQHLFNAIVRNDLCYATTNRQAAVNELCDLVELVLIIGAPNSSNCNRLREVAEANGVTAYLINGPDELDPGWLRGVTKVGITSGASTPELLVQAVINALEPEAVLPIEGAEEHVNFVLPKELRCDGGHPQGQMTGHSPGANTIT